MSLAKRAFRSGVVVTAGSLGIRLINLAAMIALARLLVPEDFGVVALALVVVSTSSLFSSVGMGSAVISSSADPRRSAYHAGLLNLGLGLAMFVAVIALADPLVELLGAPGSGSVLRWMSLVLLFETCAVVPDALLMKELQFGRRAAVQLFATVVQFGSAIVLAIAGLGLWSLVAGHVAGAAVRWMGVSALAPRIGWARPQRWDGQLALQLFRFGGTAMSTSLVRHAYTNADRVLIGRLFGTASVGFYSQSYTVTNIPAQSVSQVTNSVLLPVYARVRDDLGRLADGYATAFRLVALLTVPLSVGLLLLAPQVVITLLGEQWRPSIVLLQILAGMALFRPLAGTTSPLFLALNRPGLNLATAIVQALAMAPLVLLLYPLGVEGIAAAVTGAFALGFAFSMWQVVRRTPVPISLGRLMKGLVPILAATGVMALCVLGAQFALVELSMELETLLALLLLAGIGLATFGGAIFVFDRALVIEVAALVRSRKAPLEGLRP